MLMSFYLCVSLQGFSIFPLSCIPECIVSMSYFMFVYFLVCLQLHVSIKVGLKKGERKKRKMEKRKMEKRICLT